MKERENQGKLKGNERDSKANERGRGRTKIKKRKKEVKEISLNEEGGCERKINKEKEKKERSKRKWGEE